jgi:tetratricopeptide (TPR) repeat protein
LNLSVVQLFLIFAILPHELGHAIAAKLCGLRVFRICIGTGKKWLSMRILGFETHFLTIPMGGLTQAAHLDFQWFRLKRLTYVLAGPAINLVMAGIVLLFVPLRELFSWRSFQYSVPVGQLFFLTNLVVVIENPFPHNLKTSVGKVPSDGKAIWLTLFLKREAMEAQHALWFGLECMVCIEKGDFSGALSWCERGLILYPDNPELINLRGNALLECNQFELACECFLKLLSSSEGNKLFRAFILNNVAYADALLGRDELLSEADQYSQEALASLSWVAAVKGTHGTVLVALGRYDEALPLLRESMELAETASGKAQNACFISMAEIRLGNFDESTKYLAQARQLVPNCFLIGRAEAVLNEVMQSSIGETH